MKKAFALVALAGLVASHTALAGTIRYRLDGIESADISVSDVAPYTDVLIDVGDVGVSGATLHIYDVDGTDTSLGKITVRGRVTEAGGTGSGNLEAADAVMYEAFDSQAG